MIAVLAGATGLVGSLVLEELLENSNFSKVKSISRKPIANNNSKLEQIIVQDLSQLKSKSNELNGDVYFCCLGTTIKTAGSQENFRKVDYEAIVDFAKIAKSHEAKSFVLISAMGANAQSSIFYNRVKGETEEALKALGLQSLTIYQPGLLVGDRKETRPGEKFAIGTYHVLAKVLPNQITKKLATHALHLSHKMVQSGTSPTPGTQVIPASKI